MPGKYHIEAGWDVVGSDRKKIGSVKSCTETYCHIDTGFLGLGPDYFVPMDAIYNVRPGEVVLNVRSDQLSQMNWEQRPSGIAAAAPGTGTVARGETMRRQGVVEPERTTGRPGVAREEATTRETRSMPLREEELRAQRVREQVGEVDVTREVREERRTIDVPVTHEDVVIRTHPATANTPEDGPLGSSDEIRIPISEEHVSVSKEAHVYGEVEVEKERVVEEQRFTETVRKEVPRVEKKGNVQNRVVGDDKLKDRPLDERDVPRDEHGVPLDDRDVPHRDREP